MNREILIADLRDLQIRNNLIERWISQLRPPSDEIEATRIWVEAMENVSKQWYAINSIIKDLK